MTNPAAPHVVPFPEPQTERNRLITEHIPLVKLIAKPYQKSLPASFDFDDLCGAGFVGLIKAIDSFDPSRGCTLKKHVKTMIDRAIKDSFRRRKYQDATYEPLPAYIPAPGAPEEETLRDRTTDLDAGVQRKQESKELAGALDSLDPSERKVIHLIYVREKGVEEIGRDVGLHKSNVSRIHRRALGRLKTHYALRGRIVAA